jgi:hypothetical protein
MSSTFVMSGQRFGTIPVQRARGFRGERRFGAQLAPPSPVRSRALRIMVGEPLSRYLTPTLFFQTKGAINRWESTLIHRYTL